MSDELKITELPKPESSLSSRIQAHDSPGRLLALDPGLKRVGVAICDELQISITPLTVIERASWKDLLQRVKALIDAHRPAGLVIGLPCRLDGTEGSTAKAARKMAAKFQRSLDIPVYLQNESLTTFAAESHLRSAGKNKAELARRVDSEAAAIILRDFINEQQR